MFRNEINVEFFWVISASKVSSFFFFKLAIYTSSEPMFRAKFIWFNPQVYINLVLIIYMTFVISKAFEI